MKPLYLLALFSVSLLWSCSSSEKDAALFARHVASPIPNSVTNIVAEAELNPDLVFVAVFSIDPREFDYFLQLRGFDGVRDRNSGKLVSAIYVLENFARTRQDIGIDLGKAEYYIGKLSESEPYSYYLVSNDKHDRLAFIKLGF